MALAWAAVAAVRACCNENLAEALLVGIAAVTALYLLVIVQPSAQNMPVATRGRQHVTCTRSIVRGGAGQSRPSELSRDALHAVCCGAELIFRLSSCPSRSEARSTERRRNGPQAVLRYHVPAGKHRRYRAADCRCGGTWTTWLG